MSDEAVEYYRGVFKKVYESEDWQTYMKTKALQGEYMSGAELKQYWREGLDRHTKMLKDIGEIK
jgi:tripartite-type tricarboxylate transporter receptor subunit TctC